MYEFEKRSAGLRDRIGDIEKTLSAVSKNQRAAGDAVKALAEALKRVLAVLSPDVAAEVEGGSDEGSGDEPTAKVAGIFVTGIDGVRRRVDRPEPLAKRAADEADDFQGSMRIALASPRFGPPEGRR
jgi:hypothetical protein